MKQQNDEELVRQADALLRRATLDALTHTAAMLQMIADGTLEPSAAGVAARDVSRLLDVVRQAEAVARALRERVRTRSHRVH